MRQVCATWMMVLAALVALAVPVAWAQGADPPEGLMWNRSGLPAVFPLHIKSHAGEDFYLRLIDVESGEAVLAAYVTGGRLFRVLVPPGSFRLRFAAGRDWQGEDKLFGPGDDTRHFELPDPLTFGVRDFRTKRGHLIDLTRTGPGEMAAVRPLATCQALRLARADGPEDPAPKRALKPPGMQSGTWRERHWRERWWRLERWRFEVRSAQCADMPE